MTITGNLITGKVNSSCDYIPVLSTATSLINLFLKALSYVLPQKFKENSIFAPIKDLSVGRSLILLFPFLGNIIIAVYDNSTRKQAEALYAQAEEEADPAKAFDLLKQSAALGNIAAIRDVGYCYYFGEGVEKDIVEGVVLFAKAADLGDNVAMANLGVHFEDEVKDIAKALEWYNKAVDAGNEEPDILAKSLALSEQIVKELEEKKAKLVEENTKLKQRSLEQDQVLEELRSQLQARGITPSLSGK